MGKGTNTVRVLLGAAARVTRLSAQMALRRDGACAICPPQARVLLGAAARLGEETDRAHRFAGGRRTTGCNAGDEPA